MATWSSDEDAAGFNLINLKLCFIKGLDNYLAFHSNANLARWVWQVTGAESSGNAGSTFVLHRYNDAGAFLGTALQIIRATGDIGFNGIVNANAGLNSNGNINISAGSKYKINGVDISTSQTPWTSDIDGGNFNLNSVTNIYTNLLRFRHLGGPPSAGYNAEINTWGDELNINSEGNAFAKLNLFGMNELNFYTAPAWTKRMVIKDNGNVGIGTSSPGFKLHVEGNTGITKVLIFAGGSSSQANLTLEGPIGQIVNAGGDFYITNEAPSAIILRTVGTERMRILDSGNVGIGTSSPNYKLHVNGDVQLADHVFQNGDIEIGSKSTGDRYSLIDFHSDDTNTDYSVRMLRGPGVNGQFQLENAGTGAFVFEAKGPFYFQNNAVAKVIILGNGRVGIGVIPPAYMLDVAGDINITGSYRVNGVPLSTGTGQNQTPWLSDIDGAGHYLDNVQDININRHLTIRDSVGTSTNILIYNAFGGYILEATSFLFSAAGNTQLYINPSGNVGIGNSSPQTILQIRSFPSDSGSFTPRGAVLFKSATNNGGTSFFSAEPALILAREGVGGQAHANFVELKIQRYENVGVASRTQLDFVLTHGVPSNVDPIVMSLRSSGKVGINTNTPQYELDVAGDINFTGKLRLNGVEVDLGTTDLTPVLNRLPAALVGGKMDSVVSSLDEPGTELSSIPSTTGSLREKINFIFQYFRNKRVVTETNQTLYKENGTTVLGRGQVVDDGTSVTINEPS